MHNRNRNQTFKEQLPFIIVFLMIVSMPDIITWTTLPEGLDFNGVFVNLDDANVYLSAIRQGSEGKWLFTPQYTPESIPGILSYFPYYLIGKFRMLLGGGVLIWFQILRIAGGFFALYGLSILVKEIFPSKLQLQKTSYLLLLFGSGLSWLLIGASEQIPTYAADLLTPEWNLVTSFMSAPHFLFGIGSQAIFFTWTSKLLSNPNMKAIWRVLFAGTLLGLFYPFLIPIDGLVLAAYLGIETIKNKAVPWKKLAYLLIATVPMLLFVFYYGLYIPQNPDLTKTLLTNNQIAPPTLLGVLAGYGLLLFFSLFSIKSFSANESGRLILYWLFFNLICLYLPFNFSGRFVLGLFIPICLLAAEGLENKILIKIRGDGLTKRLSKNSSRRILILLTIPSTLLFILWTITGPQTNQGFPFYYQESEISAVDWLAERTTGEDLILADYPISNLIPRYSPARVFIGHLNLTIDLAEKQELLLKFWDPNTQQSWKSQFIEDWGVTYIYFGQFEQKYSGGKISPPGEVVYDRDGVKIYRILP